RSAASVAMQDGEERALAPAHAQERTAVARRRVHLGGTAHRSAIGLDDHVAAIEPGALGGASLAHPRHHRAVRALEAELARELRRERHQREAPAAALVARRPRLARAELLGLA